MDKYGNDALDVAADRAAWRLVVREYRWASLWALVAETIRAWQPNVRPASSIWHAPVPLHDLLHDPIMDIVVQDDEARRRAARETLRDVGRKIRERDAQPEDERAAGRGHHHEVKYGATNPSGIGRVGPPHSPVCEKCERGRAGE